MNIKMNMEDYSLLVLEKRIEVLRQIKNDLNFLLNFSDTINYISSDSGLLEKISVLEKQREAEYKKTDELANKVILDLENAYLDFLEIEKKEKIATTEFNGAIVRLKSFKKGNLSMSGDYLENFNELLEEVAVQIETSGRGLSLEKFKNIELPKVYRPLPNEYRPKYIFSKNYTHYEFEKERISKVKKYAVWESWYKIKFLPEVLHPGFQLDIKVSDFEIDYWVEMLILASRVDSKTPKKIENEKSALLDNLFRIYLFLLQTLPKKSLDDSSVSESKLEHKNDFVYNPATGLGEYKNKEIRIKIGSEAYKVFNLCVTEKDRVAKKDDLLDIFKTNKRFTNLSFSKDGDTYHKNVRRKSVAEVSYTGWLNDITKDLRTKTGLKKKLILSGGNIILVLPQIAPT